MPLPLETPVAEAEQGSRDGSRGVSASGRTAAPRLKEQHGDSRVAWDSRARPQGALVARWLSASSRPPSVHFSRFGLPCCTDRFQGSDAGYGRLAPWLVAGILEVRAADCVLGPEEQHS
jgi:hypothetical protein